MAAPRIPPIQALVAFDALARLRSVTLAGDELNVTPSAISHRIRQLETQLDVKLFTRDFGLTTEGAAYLVKVREAIAALSQLPGRNTQGNCARLRVAVTPTFSRSLLLPRLAGFRHQYPEVELVLQVTIPFVHIMAEEADIEVRFGAGPFTDRESQHLSAGVVSPVCSPDYLYTAGPFGDFDKLADVQRANLIRSPLEPWRTWFTACGIALDEPSGGAQFNDIGLALDAAVAGFGAVLTRLDLAQAWLESGRLVRISKRTSPSPHHYWICWKPGAMERWECAAFADWLVKNIQDNA